MAKYNIENVYKEINKMDGEFGVKKQGTGLVENDSGSIRKYCPHYRKANGIGYCFSYLEMARSGVINLLENLKNKNGLEYDKLAEYAILFLSYKLKQHSQHKSTNLNTFYANHIEKNEYYNKIKVNGLTCKEIIDKKKDLMNTNEISKFNEVFSILCKLYNENKKNNMDCAKHSQKAIEFAQIFEKLNNDSNINGNASYSKLLSTLSDDYNNLINKCTDFPPLPKVKTPPSKLIPALSSFSVIPVFLGIAYKTIFKKKIKKNKEENET
ncbi:CIR protein PIR protein [Plasmodium vinckei]|uniref:CIR protein PIR protein n=1 Tax=Plasmodium vinckei TaxID=5860 RepID=A0A6V7SAP0_PLAVN|nr:CIR protein PIR protein [Plasmodium vinckei]